MGKSAKPIGVVQTVSGPVPATDLGLTLPHEHIFVQLWQIPGRFDVEPQLEDEEVLAAELNVFKAQGGRSIVDLTTPDIGRDPLRLRAMSDHTGLAIVMGCGWYREAYYRPESALHRRQVGDLAKELVDEILGGVGTTGVRPGVIGEIGVENDYVSPVEERVHRAAARAQRSTGLPLATHGVFSPVAFQQLQILESEGVDLSKVAVGHCDSYPYRSHHLALAQRGVFLMFDNLGQYRGAGQHEERIASLIVDLVSAGYEGQILLSHDVCKFPQLAYHGGPGYGYVAGTFLPLLLARGLPAATLTRMTVDNPARWLGH